MVSVKQAAQTALTFAREVLGDNRVISLLLEEIELSDDGREWLVTVSIPATRISANGLAMLYGGSLGNIVEPRDYKLIRVDAADGSPISIEVDPIGWTKKQASLDGEAV